MPVQACSNCGYLIVDSSRPCPSCGASVIPSVVESDLTFDQYGNYREGFYKKVITAVIIASLVCTGGFYYFKKSHAKTQQKTEITAPSLTPSGPSGNPIKRAQGVAETIKTRGSNVPIDDNH